MNLIKGLYEVVSVFSDSVVRWVARYIFLLLWIFTHRIARRRRLGIVYHGYLLKAKTVPLHATKALGGRGSIAPNNSWPLHLRGVSGQRHAPAALYLRGKYSRYPLDRRLGGPRTGVDTEARGKIISPLPRIDPRSSIPGRDEMIFPLASVSRSALGPTQPPV
jgi:hypothetical protein